MRGVRKARVGMSHLNVLREETWNQVSCAMARKSSPLNARIVTLGVV